jgi:hypothetical protein
MQLILYIDAKISQLLRSKNYCRLEDCGRRRASSVVSPDIRQDDELKNTRIQHFRSHSKLGIFSLDSATRYVQGCRGLA